MYVCSEFHGVVDKALDYQPQGREFDPRCVQLHVGKYYKADTRSTLPLSLN